MSFIAGFSSRPRPLLLVAIASLVAAAVLLGARGESKASADRPCQEAWAVEDEIVTIFERELNAGDYDFDEDFRSFFSKDFTGVSSDFEDSIVVDRDGYGEFVDGVAGAVSPGSTVSFSHSFLSCRRISGREALVATVGELLIRTPGEPTTTSTFIATNLYEQIQNRWVVSQIHLSEVPEAAG